ncbi:SufS family cysteine desulfurase [uncultured Helcococcus sp.]|uniref:aminotransferase class V-fold PLP-dependent enzyme n=1 Tax=uncultured Helcococcus sp. TaxID=1072508 RepID=UPI00288C2C42|nr:SufS family cysteine desulfurase [uncultured Helcococcus sp.]
MRPEEIRKDFPFFEKNKNITYLDSAATSQKPSIVIDSLKEYYETFNANAGRGSYGLSAKSKEILENTREKLKDFTKAGHDYELIFTKSATEALNLVSYSYGLNNLKKDDQVLISIADHHANLVNWQYICEKTGSELKYFYLDENLNLDLEDYMRKLNSKTKIVTFTVASNVLSFEVEIAKMVEMAKEYGAVTVVDATQLISHRQIDVDAYKCDFLAFSGHKALASQGVGCLIGKKDLLNKMDPFLLGGDMIEYVTEESVSYAEIPSKFEAGTLDIGAIYSLNKAMDYINHIGYESIEKIERNLFSYLLEEIEKLDFVKIYYDPSHSHTNLIFTIENIHPHDISQILDYYGICIRTGHHCAQPLHRYLGLNSSSRVSIAFYNTKEEINRLIWGLKKVKEVFYGA